MGIKSWLPPILSKWYRDFLYRRGVKRGLLDEIKGSYASFYNASLDSGTDNTDAYAQHCLEAYLEAREKQRFSIKPQDWHLLSKVALALGRPEGLRVLDVGGGCGEYYFKLKNLLGKEAVKRWIIVENKKVVERMKGVDPILEYIDTPAEIVKEKPVINFVFISGTLQYLESPFQFLEGLGPLRSEFFCINKSILWDKPTKIMKQISPDKARSSRPIWVFNVAALREKFADLNYELLLEYEHSELVTTIPGHGHINYRGLFFKRNEHSQK